MKWMRCFATLLVAMTLVLGLIAPRPAAAIDDRWAFLEPPPTENGEPDGPGPSRLQVFRAMVAFGLLSRIHSDIAVGSFVRATTSICSRNMTVRTRR